MQQRGSSRIKCSHGHWEGSVLSWSSNLRLRLDTRCRADDTVQDIQEILATHDGHLHLGPVERPLSFLTDQFSALNEISGLQLAVSYTMPFQQASGGPGNRYPGQAISA